MFQILNLLRTSIYLISLLCLYGMNNRSMAQNCTFKLSGHVEDSDTKEKLASATVSLTGKAKTILTDESGDFEFKNLCPGSYRLVISHLDCDSVVMLVQLEKDKHLDVFLPHSHNVLKTIIVDSKPINGNDDRTILNAKELLESRGLSLSETLTKMPGVVMLQTGTNNAKPVIHGLHGNRVIIVNNGIRQEGQQWGNEHSPEIDPYIADKFSLVQGVDALRYGSDAIGGVLLVDPRPMQFGLTKGRTEIHASYLTNNFQYVISGIHERSLRSIPDLSFRIQSTFKQGGNSSTPNYRLNNTGLKEVNGSFTLAYRKSRYQTELYVSRFQNQIGIFTGSHIGNFSDLLQAIQSTRPDVTFLGQTTYTIARPRQEAVHTLLKWRQSLKMYKGKLQLLVSGQQNERKEFDIVRTASNIKPQMDLTIGTLAEDLFWERSLKVKGSMLVGITSMQQQNVYTGRYFIPNFKSISGGIYGMYKWHSGNWDLHAGGRVDHKQLSTRRIRILGDTSNNLFRFTTNAATLFIQNKPAFFHDLTWSLLFGYTSRSPHVNELLSNGIHHGTATYEQGDPSLRIERSISLQSKLLYENHSHTVRVELNGHLQHIQNFIYLLPEPDSPVLTNAGAFPKMIYRQTDAQLLGLDAVLSFSLTKHLSTELQGSTLRAKDQTQSTWLILMPADRLKNNWKYAFNTGKKINDAYISLEAIHVFRQLRVPDARSGVKDYKETPAAYSLLNLHTSATIKSAAHSITIGISVRNAMNKSYRDYLNQFRYYTDEIGRNIQFRLAYHL
jgi:iron complex outermembrane receptor protein